MTSRAAQIRAKALSLGFDALGLTSAALPEQARENLAAFLAAGYHGDMGWMEANADKRGDPQKLWPEAQSVIALGMSYAPDFDPLENLSYAEHGNISLYARGRDYHDVLKKAQRELAQWIATTFKAEVKIFVDTAPVMEKPLAQQAGLGWQGKHTCLVSRQHGGWLFLGEIFTTLKLEPDAPHADHCGTCQRCLDICPTQAFPAPHQLDARRCLAYLTIEHKGPIPEEFRKAMGNRIYGCDDCLAVCPWNRFAKTSSHPALRPRPEHNAPELLELAQLDDAGFRQRFAGTPVKRTGRDRFTRNVLIALGNAPPCEATKILAEKLLADKSPLVRGAAIWCLKQILPPAAFAILRQGHSAGEPDPETRAEWASPSL